MGIPILSNYDIDDISVQYGLNIECLTQQEIENFKHIPNTNYIVNLNADGQMGHWTALYIKNKHAYYFDSYGVQPSLYVLKFIKNNKLKLVEYNNNDIQDYHDISCGFYCLAFIMAMKKLKYKSINNFTKLFNNDTKTNINILQHFIRTYF
jgi:hypothetical protein